MYPILIEIGGFKLWSAHFFLVLGILAGIVVGRGGARRIGISDRDFRLFWVFVIPLSLLLAALNSWIFRVGFGGSSLDLQSALSTGLVSFGAVLGALGVGYLYAKRLGTPPARTLDLIATVLPLILGIYRIGCLLNGCCYGAETDGFLGFYLPAGPFGVWAYRYPTQIMLILFDFALFAWLWSRRRTNPTDGSLTLSFLFLYSLGRLIIDAFRDLPRALGPFSLHQLASIAILLITGYIALEIRWSAFNRARSAGRP
jgi:phosphatidylglycerol:prolipoprotein diacylglycerol transferase